MRSYSEKIISAGKYRLDLVPRKRPVHGPTGVYIATRWMRPEEVAEEEGIPYRVSEVPLPSGGKGNEFFPSVTKTFSDFLEGAQAAGWGKGLSFIPIYKPQRGEKEPRLLWEWENGEGLKVPVSWESLAGEDPTLWVPATKKAHGLSMRPALAGGLKANTASSDLPAVLPPVDSHATRGLIHASLGTLDQAQEDWEKMKALREKNPTSAAVGAVVGAALSPQSAVLENQVNLDILLAHKHLSGRTWEEWRKWLAEDDRLLRLLSRGKDAKGNPKLAAVGVPAILAASGVKGVPDNLWDRTWDDPLQLYGYLVAAVVNGEYESPGMQVLKEAYGEEAVKRASPQRAINNLNMLLLPDREGSALSSPERMRELMDGLGEAGGYLTSLKAKNPALAKVVGATPNLGPKTTAFASVMYNGKGHPVDRHFGAAVLGAWGLPPYSIHTPDDFAHDALGKWYEHHLVPYWRAQGVYPENLEHFPAISAIYSGLLGVGDYVPHYPFFAIPQVYLQGEV